MDMKKNLSKLERASLREAWKHEAGEFTPWLASAENLNALAEELGLSELVLVATEHWVGDFKLDIFCTDGDEQVIIENQLDETDHKHLGQILAYAAGVGAKKVIWVAESFRPEHIAALQYLNENTTNSLTFFGVQIELWRIADSPLATKFEVVAKPNDWVKSGREQARAASKTSPTKQLQFKFWSALVSEMTKQAPKIRPHAPKPRHWQSHSIGKSGVGLNVTANTRDARLGVEVWIQREDAKELFSILEKRRTNVEADLGFELDWQELPDARACRIVTYRENSPIEDETRWPEYIDWIISKVVAMNKVFRPLVEDLP